MKIIEEMNKPTWVAQKEERRSINREKYPNSYSHSYSFHPPTSPSFQYPYSSNSLRFSGLSSDSDATWKEYLKRREEHL